MIKNKKSYLVKEFCSLLFILSVSYKLYAQQPQIPSVPTWWPQYIQNSMNADREDLVKDLKKYDKKVTNFNAQCTGKPITDVGQIATCQRLSDDLDIESSAVDKKQERFMTAFHDYEKTFGSSDPNVVDARNVPSGLPKTIDDLIAGVYKNAPAGVSDRIRKGFQAVQVKDWKVARAWFQDALLLDPGNLMLQRFIALCDYSPSDKQQITTSNIQNPLPATDADTPNQAEINQWFREFNEGKFSYKANSKQAEKMRRYVLSLPIDEFKRLLNANLSNKQINDLMFDNLLRLVEEQNSAGKQ